MMVLYTCIKKILSFFLYFLSFFFVDFLVLVLKKEEIVLHSQIKMKMNNNTRFLTMDQGIGINTIF